MSKNSFFVLALEWLKIKESLGRGDKISNELFITNNTDIIKKNVSSQFESIIGELEFGHLFKTGTIIYGLQDIEYRNEELHQLLIIYNIRQIQNFLDALWLSYDNSVNFDLGFLEVKARNLPPMISSNSITVDYSNSQGQREFLYLDREQLRKTRLIRMNLWGNFPDFNTTLKSETIDYTSYNKTLRPFKGKDRVARCLFYLNFARNEALLPIKISQYCICFECLFSTDSIEISHKVSERMAFFLESEGFDKFNVYNNTKLAYKVRSSIVHGDTLPKKLQDLNSISETCDDYLRASILKILFNEEIKKIFESDKKKMLEDYFLKMCLGK